MSQLDGETVLITGASRGMGRSMALAVSEEGANVGLVARGERELNEVKDELSTKGVLAPADVRFADQVQRAVETVTAEFGTIDTLINNAGSSVKSLKGVRKEVIDVTEEEWDTVIGTNLKGPFLFSKFVLPGMIEQRSGNLINISSGLGRRPEPRWQPYLTSKWGLEGFTKSIALEVEKYNVRVNGLDPGGGVSTWTTPDESDDERLPPDVMNDAAVALARQKSGGPTGKSMNAEEWERYFDL